MGELDTSPTGKARALVHTNRHAVRDSKAWFGLYTSGEMNPSRKYEGSGLLAAGSVPMAHEPFIQANSGVSGSHQPEV